MPLTKQDVIRPEDVAAALEDAKSIVRVVGMRQALKIAHAVCVLAVHRLGGDMVRDHDSKTAGVHIYELVIRCHTKEVR